ncbi:MAG: DUF177 domain-containing protein [Melioribacter sp.]|uniref:YceD family protein n=1 Tax=Rosettibacter primus TaxID=3111523 RepID=UPI00247D1A53|nr:DUF177 domain-containing protein [Melioribacter sp.]
MIIKYTNFSDGIHQINFVEPVESLGLEESFFGNVVVNCRMDKSAHQIVIDFDVEANSHLICDRCNSQYDAKLINHFQLSYLFVKDAARLEEYDVKYLSPDEDKINIDQDVFDYVELSIPMKKLCREDCKGLCPKCGTNLNESQCNCNLDINNDIWEPLKKLKF